jgi:transcriptional regulator with XRE-family HTH domain
MAERDFLEKIIDKRTARNPEFPRLLDAARRRRELLRSLAEQREQQERSQTAIAAAMDTSQSFIARLETTAGDAKISTVDRYAESLGFTVQYHLIPTSEAANMPPVVVRAAQIASRRQAKPRRQVSASASAR